MRLRELRLENGLTQQALVNYLKCSYNKYFSWEKGRTEPSVDDLKLLADYYNVSIDYLVGRCESDGVIYANSPALPDDEQELLSDYRKLNFAAKGKVRGYIQGLLSAPGVATVRPKF